MRERNRERDRLRETERETERERSLFYCRLTLEETNTPLRDSKKY